MGRITQGAPLNIQTTVFPPSQIENPDNPKKKFGLSKVCISYIPKLAIFGEAIVMALGAHKYGAFNWRSKAVEAETYLDAAARHMALWEAGEDNDDESGESHLNHVRACMGIVIDAMAHGKLIDNRIKSQPLIDFIKSKVKPVENATTRVVPAISAHASPKLLIANPVLADADLA